MSATRGAEAALVASSGRQLVPVAAGWLVAAAALYLLTGAQGLAWGDPSKLTLYAIAGYLPSLNPGDHAGWTAIAWAWLRLIGGDPVVAGHRLSALAGAFAVAAAAVLALRRGHDRATAHTTAVVLLVAHPLWWAAGVAETYAPALAAALLGAVAATFGGAWLLLAGVAWGAAMAIHPLTLAVVVPLAWVLAGRRPLALLPGLAIGLAPLWLALFRTPADPLTGFTASGAGTWGWHLGAFLDLGRAPGNAVIVAALLLYALGPLGVLGVVRGGGATRTSTAWWLALAAVAALLLLYARYRLHLLAVFPVAVVLLARPPRLPTALRLAHVALQAAIYAAAPLALAAAGHGDLGVRVLPHRDNSRHFLDPIRRADRGPDLYLAEAAACLPEGAALVADFNTGAVIRLAQVARSFRPDVTVAPVAVDVALARPDPAVALLAAIRAAGARPVALADAWEPYYRLRELAARCGLERCGPLVLVRGCPGDG